MPYDPRDRLGHIRVRWVTVLAALALVPLVVVLGAIPYQLVVQARLGNATTAAVQRAATATDLAAVARHERVRIQVFDGPRVVERYGRTITSRWTNHVALHFVDRQTAAAVVAFDESTSAPDSPTAGTDCALALDGKILECHAWGRDARGRTIVAEAAAVRTVSTLWGHRAPLLAVVLQMLLVALALGLWFGRRTVGPIHRLRREVADRTTPPVSTERVSVQGRDEVAELAHSFNDLLAALQAQRESNMDFLSEIAHELKTPIATIQQFADLARTLDDPRLERPLAAVESSCARLHVRVGELMELARAAAGLPDQAREAVQLDAFVRNVAGAHPADVAVSGTPLHVSANARYLEIALGNVLDNALGNSCSRIWIEITSDGADAVVLVRDDGPGIALEDLDRVFERFHSRRQGGTGLGLAMTRAVLRAHGGEARALPCSSGAAIELRLPMVSATRQSYPDHD